MRVIKVISISFFLLLVASSALMNLYIESDKIFNKLKPMVTKMNPDLAGKYAAHFSGKLVNPLKKSLRQVPPDEILDLNINENAHLKGQWSAPIDWNVTAIHTVLLPNSNVMSFGTFGISEKQNR